MKKNQNPLDTETSPGPWHAKAQSGQEPLLILDQNGHKVAEVRTIEDTALILRAVNGDA